MSEKKGNAPVNFNEKRMSRPPIMREENITRPWRASLEKQMSEVHGPDLRSVTHSLFLVTWELWESAIETNHSLRTELTEEEFAETARTVFKTCTAWKSSVS